MPVAQLHTACILYYRRQRQKAAMLVTYMRSHKKQALSIENDMMDIQALGKSKVRS